MKVRNIAGLLSALLIVACATKTETRPTDQGVVSARLLRVDPVTPGETGTQADFVLRVQNGRLDPITVKTAYLEVYFSDDLSALPVDDSGEASDGAQLGEGETAGSGGDVEEEVEVFEGEVSSGQVVASGMYVDVTIPIALSYPEKPEDYVAFCKLGIAHLGVEGTVATSEGTLVFKDEGEIPAPGLPEAQAVQVQVATTGGGVSGDLTMVLRIYNPNVFAFKIRGWDYKLYVHDKLMREATIGVGERIQSNTAIQYDTAVQLNEKTWGSPVKDVLGADSLPFHIEGTLRFRDIEIPTHIEDAVTFTH